MPSKRNVLAWYAISIVTFGIGGLVWYYLVNRDAKQLAGNKGWSPAMSVVAVTLGVVLIAIPPIVSAWRTWSRVREATNADGMSAGIQFVLIFVPLVNLLYMGVLQSKLNAAVERGAARAPSAALAG